MIKKLCLFALLPLSFLHAQGDKFFGYGMLATGIGLFATAGYLAIREPKSLEIKGLENINAIDCHNSSSVNIGTRSNALKVFSLVIGGCFTSCLAYKSLHS